MKITTLFLDVGGVLLTNGWGHELREKTAKHFNFDYSHFEELHKRYYDEHERDLITLDEYFEKTLFYEPRNFTVEQLKKYIKGQTQCYQDMIDFIINVKEGHGLKVVIVSNEGRELTGFRIETFRLKEVADLFVVSCFVNHRKPGEKIYQMALDISQSDLEEVIYIDDRPNLIEAAKKLGIRGIIHKSVRETREELLRLL